MSNSLQGFDLIPEVDLTANEKARRVVAGHSADTDDARELLDALGLLSTGGAQPVDKRRSA
jgi:hypothetical protein